MEANRSNGTKLRCPLGRSPARRFVAWSVVSGLRVGWLLGPVQIRKCCPLAFACAEQGICLGLEALKHLHRKQSRQ